MKCRDCPALIYGLGIDDEWWSGCGLEYKQIPYKNNNDGEEYCRKHLKTIIRQKEIKEKEKSNG